jgi:hypothetical protein
LSNFLYVLLRHVGINVKTVFVYIGPSLLDRIIEHDARQTVDLADKKNQIQHI